MKRLILFLWLLIGANIFGANPAFTAFRGTNGFKISTNVSQGVVIYDSYFTNTFLNTWTLNAGGDLSNALATLPNNSTLYITPGAWTNRMSTFGAVCGVWTNSDWLIKGKTNCNIIGVGWPTLWTTNYGDHFTMTNCQNVMISGLEFRTTFLTTNQVQQQYAACWMVQNRDVTWDGCRFISLGSFGVITAGSGGQNTNTIIRNCYFRRIGTIWAGPSIDGSAIVPDSYWTIENNVFDECYRGIEFFYGVSPCFTTPTVIGTVVRNNRFINYVLYGVFDGATGTNDANHIIEGNTFSLDDKARIYSTNTWAQSYGVQLTSGRGMIIRNNNFISGNVIDPSVSVAYAIQIDSGVVAIPPRDFQIIGNTFSNCPSPIDIRGNVNNAPARNFLIKDNYMINARNSGILLCHGNDHVIEGNTIVDCGLNSGAPIFLGLTNVFIAGTNNVIRNNRIYNSPGVSSIGAGIKIDTDQYTNVFYGNLVRAGSPLYSDSGVGTKINPDYSASVLATYNAGGVYTNQPFDSIVRLPNSTVASGARTNLLRLAASMNGQIITIEDQGMTASGAASNIWLLCAGSDTINHGPPRTNQANNGGTITVQSDGVSNWSIIGKFP